MICNSVERVDAVRIVYIVNSIMNNNYKKALKTRLFENKSQVVANTRVLSVHF